MSQDAGVSPLESPLMPEGSLLLHIGPPKTGTTSLQAAFWAARDAALAQGVRYAGWSRHSGRAAMAVAKSSPGVKDRPEIRQWDALVDQVRRAREPRVVLSSEHLSYAKPPAISRVVGDLEPRLIHVVVTLRPLVRILPSRWQEYAKDGLGLTYEDWLDAVLSEPPKGITPTFWLQQRHDALVARWAEVVGAGRVTVVVADDGDHDGLLRIFERFTGLRAGTLVPVHDLSNRSLTRAEVDAVQALNRLLRAEGFTGQRIDEVVREIAARNLLGRRPDPGRTADRDAPVGAGPRGGDLPGDDLEHRLVWRNGHRRSRGPCVRPG